MADFLRRQPDTIRRALLLLAAGHQIHEVAARLGVASADVACWRRNAAQEWQELQAELVNSGHPS